jgi:predicted DNA-binding protein (MmcQ/YjbR family)
MTRLTVIRRDIIDYCLTLPAAYEDYPFDEAANENATAVMRHRGNKRSFAFVLRHNGELYLNLKCDPLDGDFLRSAFESIIPAWHMNKNHWITVVMGGDVPDDLTKTLIAQSYDLIKPKARNQKGTIRMSTPDRQSSRNQKCFRTSSHSEDTER